MKPVPDRDAWPNRLAVGASVSGDHSLVTAAAAPMTLASLKLKPESCLEFAAHSGPAAGSRAGKAAILDFRNGQVLKLSTGKANRAMAGEILERMLKG